MHVFVISVWQELDLANTGVCVCVCVPKGTVLWFMLLFFIFVCRFDVKPVKPSSVLHKFWMPWFLLIFGLLTHTVMDTHTNALPFCSHFIPDQQQTFNQRHQPSEWMWLIHHRVKRSFLSPLDLWVSSWLSSNVSIIKCVRLKILANHRSFQRQGIPIGCCALLMHINVNSKGEKSDSVTKNPAN